MPVLPVPDVVREMERSIVSIARMLENLEKKIDRLSHDVEALKNGADHWRAMSPKISQMHGALDVAKDQLAWLCASKDKTS